MTQLLYRVGDVAPLLGLGRTKTYQLISRGVIRSVRVDSALRIPASAIEEFVHTLEATPIDGGRAA